MDSATRTRLCSVARNTDPGLDKFQVSSLGVQPSVISEHGPLHQLFRKTHFSWEDLWCSMRQQSPPCFAGHPLSLPSAAGDVPDSQGRQTLQAPVIHGSRGKKSGMQQIGVSQTNPQPPPSGKPTRPLAAENCFSQSPLYGTF